MPVQMLLAKMMNYIAKATRLALSMLDMLAWEASRACPGHMPGVAHASAGLLSFFAKFRIIQEGLDPAHGKS